MKHIGFYFLSLITFLLSSCVDSNFSAGDSILTSNVRNVIVDTCTVQLHTVLTDSTKTSGISKVFMGKYISSDLGTITASAFMSFGVPSVSKSADFAGSAKTKTVIDSVCLILRYDGFRYGDTTQVQTINVSKLTDKLDELYSSHSSAFYNTDEAAASSSVYVTKSFKRPQISDENDSTLLIRLPDAFGQTIIDSLKAQSDYMTSETKFIQFFRGFKLSPGSDDKYCINAFKMSSSAAPKIVIYYHSIDNVPTEQKITINANTSYAFSNVKNDRSSSTLKNLVTGSEGIISSSTANKAFVQGITGFSTYMTFPSVASMSILGKYTKVSAAYLYVYPVKNSYDLFLPLPSTAKLNFVNKLGTVKDVYTETTTSLTSGSLTEDTAIPYRYYYPFDVTTFIKAQIGAAQADWGTLQFTLSDTDKAQSLKSITIGDSNYPDENYRIKLVIQFLVYDNN
ncbi:MAG: DUF4270 family protein [Dysgonamonadaceae bacterium]